MKRTFRGIAASIDADPPAHWGARAACLPHADLFNEAADHSDPKPRERTHDSVLRAKAICRLCPVLAECREWAVAELEHGIAGGLDPKQRMRLRRGRV